VSNSNSNGNSKSKHIVIFKITLQIIMKVIFSILLFSMSLKALQISGSPDLKTLQFAGLDPSLAIAVKSALTKKYQPRSNSSGFTNSFVSHHSP
jgi:hypothetical protein